MDIDVTIEFKNGLGKKEKMKLSFTKCDGYNIVINLSELGADAIEFENFNNFKENLYKYIEFNYGMYDYNGEIQQGHYYSDRKRIAAYLQSVKQFINL